MYIIPSLPVKSKRKKLFFGKKTQFLLFAQLFIILHRIISGKSGGELESYKVDIMRFCSIKNILFFACTKEGIKSKMKRGNKGLIKGLAVLLAVLMIFSGSGITVFTDGSKKKATVKIVVG